MCNSRNCCVGTINGYQHQRMRLQLRLTMCWRTSKDHWLQRFVIQTASNMPLCDAFTFPHWGGETVTPIQYMQSFQCMPGSPPRCAYMPSATNVALGSTVMQSQDVSTPMC